MCSFSQNVRSAVLLGPSWVQLLRKSSSNCNQSPFYDYYRAFFLFKTALCIVQIHLEYPNTQARPNTFLDELLVISLVYTIIMIKDKKT